MQGVGMIGEGAEALTQGCITQPDSERVVLGEDGQSARAKIGLRGGYLGRS